MKLAVGISVCGWVPERVERAKSLLADLPLGTILSVSEQKEHARVWWYRLAKELLATDADAFVFLNDDIELCPNFMAVVEAALEACGEDVLSLHTSFPDAPSVAKVGWCFCRGYWLTGPGYVITRQLLQDVIAWRETLSDEAKQLGNEDDWIGVYRYVHRQPIWSTTPALVKHDTTFETQIEEHRQHEHRTTTVPWADFARGFSTPARPPPILQNPYKPWPFLQQLEMAFRGIAPVEQKRPSLFLSVVGWTAGWVHVRSREQLVVECMKRGWDLLVHPDITTGVDRARNISAAEFLKSDADYWLQVDSDIMFDPADVFSMLEFLQESDEHVVGGAYPKKGVEYGCVAQAVREGVKNGDLAKYANDFVIGGPLGSTIRDNRNGNRFMEVGLLGTGFLMVTRAGLEKFAAFYGDEIAYTANYEPYVGERHHGFFMCELNVNHPRRKLGLAVLKAARAGTMSQAGFLDLCLAYHRACKDPHDLPNYQTEDWSFCDRWRQMGGKCWLFVECRLPHQGPAVFQGEIGAAVFPKDKPPRAHGQTSEKIGATGAIDAQT
jgi:hypothetical protein